MRIVAFAALAWLLAGTGAQAADCASSGVPGLYDGTAKAPDVSVDVTLNLYCLDGRLTAQLFTSMGDFAVRSTTTDTGHVSISFDSGAALGTFELTPRGQALEGTAALGDEKGTIVLTRTGAALAPDAMRGRLDLTAAQWHADLAFLTKELPRRHANAFYLLPAAAFEREVAELDRRIATANGDEMFVGLQRIVKSIGDGHTGLVAPPDRRVMPLEVAKFGDDLRVVAVGPGLEKALGARIVKMGGMAVADVWSRVMTLAPQGELEQLQRINALVYLARGYALHGLDITADRNHARYTLLDDKGQTFDLDIAGLEPDQTVAMRSLSDPAALRFKDKDAPFTCTVLAPSQSVYCAWRSYQDLAKNAKAMFALIGSSGAQRAILDMRDNGGGDNTVGYAEIVKPLLARTDLNRKGHLYVLIGADTFSAAMNNAAQFQDETNAILVGETIGEKPNSYQEPRQFRLPNSHLAVRVSTLYYTFRKTGENAVRPDKEIIPSWNDVKAGRDPVLDWVLAEPLN